MKSNRIGGMPDAQLQLGNGYYLEFDAFSRLLDVAFRDHRSRIPTEAFASAIGGSDRQAKHFAALAKAMGLLEKKTNRPTALGRLVKSQDPFFDDLGTLWFLHYVISSDPRNIIWNRIVNQVLPIQNRFTKDLLRATFDDLRLYYSDYSLKTHVLKELNTFLDAYLNQSFSRLAFIRTDGDGFALAFRQPVPALVLAAAIARYRVTCCSGDTVIPIPDLCRAPNSPGIVFAMPEERLRALLEELKTQPGFSLESRADLDQVRMPVDLTDVDWMRRYYDER